MAEGEPTSVVSDMENDDRRQFAFLNFVAERVGSREWFILEAGDFKRAVTGKGKAITRRAFEKLRREFASRYEDA